MFDGTQPVICQESAMNRTSLLGFVVGIACGLTVATGVAGCSKAADRTLTLTQFQSTSTAGGQFRIDTTALPADAIEKRTDTGGPGSPKTVIQLKIDYAVEVVLRPVEKI
jgi:hypothetical protein